MKVYIATVWTLSATAMCVDGYTGICRQIVRGWAESPRDFEARIRDWYISDPDNDVWFGPIGLSKNQEKARQL